MKKEGWKKDGCCLFVSLSLLASVGLVGSAEEPELPQPQNEIYIGSDCMTTNSESVNAIYAFDNKKDTGKKWEIKAGEWVKIDFGMPVKVESYMLCSTPAAAAQVNNNEGVMKATLEVSDTGGDDAAEWQVVDTVDNSNPEKPNETLWNTLDNIVVDTPTAARYYRLTFPQVAAWNKTTILEMKFYSSEQYENILLNKQVVFNSRHHREWQTGLSMPAQMIDGDFNTMWSAEGDIEQVEGQVVIHDATHESIIDLGAFYNIKRWFMANITWENVGGSATQAFTLSYLKPDGTWEVFAEREETDTALNGYGGVPTEEVNARYIRLYVSKPGTGAALNIRELQMFGTKLPDTQQANLASAAVVFPIDNTLVWDAVTGSVGVDSGTIVAGSTGTALNYTTGQGGTTWSTFRFAVPEALNLSDAQAIDFTMSEDATADAKPRIMQVALEEVSGEVTEKYCVDLYIKAGSGSEIFSIPIDGFVKEANTEGDGILDLSKVTHISLTARGNDNSAGTAGSVTFTNITIHKNKSVAMNTPVRLEQSNGDDTWTDITDTGLVAGDVRLTGSIKNLDAEPATYTIFAGVYEKAATGNAVLKKVAMTQVVDAEYGKDDAFTLSLTVPENPENYQIKAFVWYDNMLLPITEGHVFE